MPIRQIVKLVEFETLSEDQKSKLNKVLLGRKAQLEKALSDVNEGLKLLKRAGKKRKTGKKRTTKRR